jgi:hypothetical protein
MIRLPAREYRDCCGLRVEPRICGDDTDLCADVLEIF